MNTRLPARRCISLVASLLLAMTCAQASAAVFNVNSTADLRDSSSADGLCKPAGDVCTLRAAIEQARASGGTNTINVPPGTYTLNPAFGELSDSTEGKTLAIAGSGAPGTTIIDGQNATRIFDLVGGTTTLTNLVIQNGFAMTSSSGPCWGAGVFAGNPGTTVNMVSSVIQKNIVVNLSGGGVCVYDGAVVTIDRSVILDNRATYGGGGIRNANGVLRITNSTISGNASTGQGAGGAGGGIEHQGTLLITNSTIQREFGPVFRQRDCDRRRQCHDQEFDDRLQRGGRAGWRRSA